MANINKNEIGYNETLQAGTANALMVQYKRANAAPLDISDVFTSISAATEYALSGSTSYAGQVLAVAGEDVKTEVFTITSAGTIVRLVDENDLLSVKESAGKIDVIKVNNTELEITDKTVNIDLSDYATHSFVTEQIVSAMTGGEIELTGYAKIEEVKRLNSEVLSSANTYTDNAVSDLQSKIEWIEAEETGTKHIVRHWRGTRENYELLKQAGALNAWTKYVVIDNITDTQKIITEYFGENQIAEHTGQLLPVNSIIETIQSATNPNPYDRYLVGRDGIGYRVYECALNNENNLKWYITQFDDKYGVRVRDRGLKNFVYVDGKLITYDDVNCGEF